VYSSTFNQFSFNPSSINTIWAITGENELAMATPEAINEIKNEEKSCNLTMSLQKVEVKSYYQAKSLFSL